jgi:small subunit ribosomal protein S6e
MAEFKLTINDPKTGKSYKKEVSGSESDVFRGKKIGDVVSGNAFGLSGYELEITGGSDKDGFPMRGDIEGTGRKKPLVVSGVGARPKGKGIKQRKTVRGNVIDVDISQINLKVVKEGNKKLEEIFSSGTKENEEGAQEGK